MQTRELETKPKTQSTDTAREHEGLDRPQQPQVTFARFSPPWGQSMPPPGISSSPQYHAGILRRANASGSSNMHQAMLQLQRRQGNHFVGRVIELSRNNEGEFGTTSNLEGVIPNDQLTQRAGIGKGGAPLNRSTISASRAQRKCTDRVVEYYQVAGGGSGWHVDHDSCQR